MRILNYIAMLIAIAMTIPSPASAKLKSVTKDVDVFQNLCLKYTKTCLYTRAHFLTDSHVDVVSYEYLYLLNAKSLRTYNIYAKKILKYDTYVNSAYIFNNIEKKWNRITGEKGCAFCHAGDARSLREGGWVRIKRIINHRARHSSFISISYKVNHSSNKFVKISVVSDNGVKVYADTRLNGAHQLFSTIPTGSFEMVMSSDWAINDWPDYAVISPVKSWGGVSQKYDAIERVILSKPNILPKINGSIDSVINQSVDYMARIKYVSTPNDSTFPLHDVNMIINNGTGDCKDYVTVLEALLLKAGIVSHPVLLNSSGRPPLSFSVPSHWPDHVILYVPKIKKYIDMTIVIGSDKKITWQLSQRPYAGEIALDVVTRRFVVIR